MSGGTYLVGQDERWPCLVLSEDPRGIELPEPLVKRLAKATAALEEAENEVARWIKYSRPDASGQIRAIIERLPTADERKKERKR